ncbi:NADH dehydrogenase (ubiquinone) 1 beta subcomplex, 6 [Cichlidogyrus casuarinus]|uniref:NADH dehydrogenase (Ubiquinone) 1 beta subcomplex, 6 n=1 Tax=Cichlidogyrus casuarinus TaxID=1844966 RepID=A0ABD2PLH0_9PLAT
MTKSEAIFDSVNSSYYDKDPFVRDLQKKIYVQELNIRHNLTFGGKYAPFSIEPFPRERDRLASPFTDEDRKLRKQWLEDQKLSLREPVSNPSYTNNNIFRRIYSAPYDALTKAVTPLIGDGVAPYFRKVVPKVFGLYFGACILWYRVKYNHRVWYEGHRGMYAGLKSRPGYAPGHPWALPTNDFDYKRYDCGFSERECYKGDKFVTSSA